MTSTNNNDNKCDQVANFLTKLRKIDPDGSLYAVLPQWLQIRIIIYCCTIVMNNRNYILTGTVNHTKQIAIPSFITICI